MLFRCRLTGYIRANVNPEEDEGDAAEALRLRVVVFRLKLRVFQGLGVLLKGLWGICRRGGSGLKQLGLIMYSIVTHSVISHDKYCHSTYGRYIRDWCQGANQ